MKKQVFGLLLALSMLLTATACSSGENADTTTVTTTEATATEATTTEATTIAETEPATEVELVISAAASLTESLETIAALYKEIAPNVTLTYNFGASGKLQTQIEEGVPADLFLSAAQKQMNALEDEGLIDAATRLDLLVNKVVLIVPADSDSGITGFEDVYSDKVTMIAIGDPESVPVGQYAQEIFTYLEQWDAVLAKANLGTDVKEVLQWTATGNVDCGIVYATDAATESGVTVVAEAPEGSHSPVVYPAAVLTGSEYPDEAQAFLDFLSTDEAAAVFVANGFTMSE